MSTLGVGDNRAYVYDRFGRTQLIELVTTSLEWNRELCAVSKATINVGARACKPEHSRISHWAHSIVVFRGDDRVWEGPIRRAVTGRNGLSIVASDVLGWTERRAHGPRDVAGSPVVTELAATLADAFGPDDPNVLAFLQIIGDVGPGVTRTITNGSSYAAAALADLVGGGGRYTALGRAILLWADSTSIGRTQTLVPEKHLLVDVDVVQDGDSFATFAVARDDAGNVAGAEAPAGFLDPFYGLVTLLTTAPGSVEQYAASTVAQAYPEQTTLDVPGGAALSCDAPFPIAQLVPGVLVPVETTTATGKTISATMQLASVKVAQSAGDDDKVSITLAPLSSAVG